MAIIDVKTEITGNVWKIVVEAGDNIEEDQPIMILESMKMEIPVSSPESGVVLEILVEPDQTILEGSVVARVESLA
ncbi:MAG: acetyl-CoA carboxylase biotin carboxyl carrier protein subunit [Rhodospirillaceae bacterium TMED8]|nr:acetyl-CoA carboxylase biotin carboxyl carrier protein subunit [Magnetovibrio sp.]OUT51593.1 MAG: acetyl-CoA carboxylase biotin carboxyl carrier protein subunit [Rhodospirillaceae bacterium TMED8]